MQGLKGHHIYCLIFIFIFCFYFFPRERSPVQGLWCHNIFFYFILFFLLSPQSQVACAESQKSLHIFFYNIFSLYIVLVSFFLQEQEGLIQVSKVTIQLLFIVSVLGHEVPTFIFSSLKSHCTIVRYRLLYSQVSKVIVRFCIVSVLA